MAAALLACLAALLLVAAAGEGAVFPAVDTAMTSEACKAHAGLNPARIQACPPSACSPGSQQCFTFTGACDNPMVLACPHIDTSLTGTATMVTAFWDLRKDRGTSMYLKWLKDSIRFHAPLIGFLPESMHGELYAVRESMGLKAQTCFLTMPREQLPYGYLIPAVNSTLRLLRHRMRDQYKTWYWRSPELTNPAYVPLNAGKIPLLHAVATEFNLFSSPRLVWVDAGISRHMNVPALDGLWPTLAAFNDLDPRRTYTPRWDGYGSLQQPWRDFCASPEQEFVKNRNHFAGCIIFTTPDAVKDLFPVWTFLLEEMVRHQLWNNEQVMFELIGCYLPELVGVVDHDGLSVEELADEAGGVSTVVVDPSWKRPLPELCSILQHGGRGRQHGKDVVPVYSTLRAPKAVFVMGTLPSSTIALLLPLLTLFGIESPPKAQAAAEAINGAYMEDRTLLAQSRHNIASRLNEAVKEADSFVQSQGCKAWALTDQRFAVTMGPWRAAEPNALCVMLVDTPSSEAPITAERDPLSHWESYVNSCLAKCGERRVMLSTRVLCENTTQWLWLLSGHFRRFGFSLKPLEQAQLLALQSLYNEVCTKGDSTLQPEAHDKAAALFDRVETEFFQWF